MPHTYISPVCWLNDDVDHSAPPLAPGHVRIGWVVKGVKMPAVGYEPMVSVHACGTNGSPIGQGWVGAVFWSPICGTKRSSMPISGAPDWRSSRYTQPVLPAWPTPLTALPFIWTSNNSGGLVTS